MGILHRDIKPSNLLVDSRGNLWVTDFGLARFQDEPGLTRTGDLLGTLRYLAPELATGHRVVHDPRSDVYSLGATLYELLSLRPVFDGRDRQTLLRQIVQQEPIPPRRLDPTVPRDLETIVLKAMDKEPNRRYATGRELAEDLGRFLEDKTILARRAMAFERAAKWTRRHRAVVAVAGAVAFAALAIATPLLWWEQRNTASMYRELHLAVGQADLGFEQMMRLSDELAIKGMARFAEPSRSPRATETRLEYYRHAVEFYDRLVREPQIGKPMKALAYRRLGFARLMGLQDPRAGGDLERSLALYEELLADTPRDPEVQAAIADVLLNLGMVLLSSRKIAQAENSFRGATSLDEELVAQFPEDPRFVEQLTGRRLQVAAWLEGFGLRQQAEQQRRELLAWYEQQAAGASRSSARYRSGHGVPRHGALARRHGPHSGTTGSAAWRPEARARRARATQRSGLVARPTARCAAMRVGRGDRAGATSDRSKSERARIVEITRPGTTASGPPAARRRRGQEGNGAAIP